MTTAPGTSHRAPRLVGALLLGVAAVLAAWTVWLAVDLGPDEHPWHWVGIDVTEVAGLTVTGVLLVRGSRRRSAAGALLTAPLFVFDALLDVTSSHVSTPDLAVASAMALAAEVPAACALVWIAYRCVRPARTVAT